MLRELLLVAALVVLLWASYLAFGFTDNADLTEDALGWGFLSLGLGVASFIDVSKYHR